MLVDILLPVYCRKKTESMGGMANMSQEEIVSSTRTVFQGLEALRGEHKSILSGLEGSLRAAQQERLDAHLMREKASLVHKSLEMIELGIGEAQIY
ncbi:unnamed protein product [Darwinula stevensoni]|uniref:Uncharacterized protein n=1 Tax=Darwinula stevensoni TaxID=69355 RepID=A0A7R9A1R6_9CRUS|nr:unnamed protein product [Darwinula stevensoni]CAG0888261.1 unnamed protein product [Darwinula stevensoni]